MSDAPENHQQPTAVQILPEGLLRLVLADLDLSEGIRGEFAARDLVSVADLLTLPAGAAGFLSDQTAQVVRRAIGQAIDRHLPQAALPFDANDWPSLHGHLLLPLDDSQRRLLRALLGIDEAPTTITQFARRSGLDLRSAEALAERVRTRLHERSRLLITHLRDAVRQELHTFGGLLDPANLAPGTMLHTMAAANLDTTFPLRLAAFCFPHEYHLHDGLLVATPRRTLRRFVDRMRMALLQRRLPLPLDTLLDELDAERRLMPSGLVIYLLRQELRMSVSETDDGAVILRNPKSPTSRLDEILDEEGKPMQLLDLVFAYRERYRRVTPQRLEQHLRRDTTFVLVGPETFALRRWHADEHDRVVALADGAAHHVCAAGGKQNLLAWLAAEGCTGHLPWLVLDQLRHDERVRLLGRGEACPATQRRSQVMAQLLVDFRRACGEVVESMFVANQPSARRRLVQRLLSQNRLFVRPGPDRVDTLTNYPFNDARLRRLRKITTKTLEDSGGYAPVHGLVAAVCATDLGGSWLTDQLLEEVVRRQGWFDVLPGHIVALPDRGLADHLARQARQALRAAGVLLSVDEIVRQRPDLCEFTDCLRELLQHDPLVQSPDGRRFSLV